MAYSGSYAKKENEKKKQAKRLEKAKRKEERKSGGTRSMDDMIAYVDEHGRIVDTPPDQEREEIELESIEISVPKKEDTGPDVYKGRVEYFNSDKGYGFIKDTTSGEKYFFHISAAPRDIAEGKTVEFETERSTRGLNAINIKIQ